MPPKTISEQQTKHQISEYFPWCPFCCYEPLKITITPQQNQIHCTNCGATWQINTQGKNVKLTTTSIDQKGKDLLQKETEPKYWQNKAWLCIITRKTP